MPVCPPLARAGRLPLLILLAPIAGAGAQRGDYNVPGAIRLLEQGDVASFPDNKEARQWLAGLLTGLADQCGTPPDPQLDGSLLRRTTRHGQYLASAVPKLAEGIEDARSLVRDRGCASLRRLWSTASNDVSWRYGARRPNPFHFDKFRALASPEMRRALDAQRPSVAARSPLGTRQEVARAAERYLRSRVDGSVSDATLRTLADSISDLLAIAPIPERFQRRFLSANGAGEPELRLYEIESLADGDARMVPPAVSGVAEALVEEISPLLQPHAFRAPWAHPTMLGRRPSDPTPTVSPLEQQRRRLVDISGRITGTPPYGPRFTCTTQGPAGAMRHLFAGGRPDGFYMMHSPPRGPAINETHTVPPTDLRWDAVQVEQDGPCLRVRVPTRSGGTIRVTRSELRPGSSPETSQADQLEFHVADRQALDALLKVYAALIRVAAGELLDESELAQLEPPRATGR